MGGGLVGFTRSATTTNVKLDDKSSSTLAYSLAPKNETTATALWQDWVDKERQQRHMALQRSLQIIPPWMTEYFQWHHEQRTKLLQRNKASIDNLRYLVFRCWEGDKCGGLSDRMKPMPYFVMIAALTNRYFWPKYTSNITSFHPSGQSHYERSNRPTAY